MTGKDLIIYILKNDLEDEPVFKDGAFVGFITMEEAAAKYNVGVGTIYAWMVIGKLDYIRLGEEYLVFADCELISDNKNGFRNTQKLLDQAGQAIQI